MKFWNRLWCRAPARQPAQLDRGPIRVPALGVDEYELIIDYVFIQESLPEVAWKHLITFTHAFPTVDKKCLHALRLSCSLIRSLVDMRVRQYVDLREAHQVINFFHTQGISKASSEEFPTLILGIGAGSRPIIKERRLADLTDAIQIICRSPRLQWLIFNGLMSFDTRRWRACAAAMRGSVACSQVTRFDFLSIRNGWGVEALSSQCFFDLLFMMPALSALLCGPVILHHISALIDGADSPLIIPTPPPPFRLTILTVDLGQASVTGCEEVQRWLLSNSHDSLQSFALINNEWMLMAATANSLRIPIEIAGSSLRHLHLDINDRSGIDNIARCISLCPGLEELAIPLFGNSGKLGSEGLTACLDAVHKPLRHFIVVGESPTGPLVGFIRKGHHALANLRRVTCRHQMTYPGHDALEKACKEKNIRFCKI